MATFLEAGAHLNAVEDDHVDGLLGELMWRSKPAVKQPDSLECCPAC